VRFPKLVRSLLIGGVAAGVAVGVAVAGVALQATSAQAAGSAACKPYTIIGVRGTNDGAYNSIGNDLPMAVAGFGKIKGAAAVLVDHVKYPAAGGDQRTYFKSVAKGKTALRSKINHWLGTCRSTRLVLLGYSQGAHVVGDVVARMPRSQRNRLYGVGLMGDPRFNPNLRGSISNNYGPALHGIPGKALGGMWGERPSWPGGVFVADICNTGDQVCASFDLLDSGLFLLNTGGHHDYTNPIYSPVAPAPGACYVGVHVATRSLTSTANTPPCAPTVTIISSGG
jgi:hypothetical protein